MQSTNTKRKGLAILCVVSMYVILGGVSYNEYDWLILWHAQSETSIVWQVPTTSKPTHMNTKHKLSVNKHVVHKHTIVPNCTNKQFLVFACRASPCGGLGDRQRGIVFTYLLSLLTDRVFIIDMSYPCLLETHLDTNRYDWKKCKPQLSKFDKHQHKDYFILDKAGVQFAASLDRSVTDSWRHYPVVTFVVNGSYLKFIRNHPDVAKRIPWILSLSEAEVFHAVLGRMFTPNQKLAHDIETFFKEQVKGRQLICSHIRYGRNPSMPGDYPGRTKNVTRVLSFLDDYTDSNKYAIYIATDAMHIRVQAKNRFPNFVTTNTSIVHIDQVGGDKPESCNGMYDAVLEQLLLSKSDTLVITSGNFGIMAAYMRGHVNNLYVNDEKHTNSVVRIHRIEEIQRLFEYA